MYIQHVTAKNADFHFKGRNGEMRRKYCTWLVQVKCQIHSSMSIFRDFCLKGLRWHSPCSLAVCNMLLSLHPGVLSAAPQLCHPSTLGSTLHPKLTFTASCSGLSSQVLFTLGFLQRDSPATRCLAWGSLWNWARGMPLLCLFCL